MQSSGTQRILCAWCSRFFDWTPGPGLTRPMYCKKTHKKAAGLASARFREHFTSGRCPTPQKKAFDDATAALRWLRAFDLGGNRPYECSCGRFHAGRVKRGISAPG